MKTKPMLVLLSAALLAAGSPQAQENAMEKETTFRQIFPQGGKLPEQFAQYFIGQAYLCPITDNDTLGMHVSNVTFEPGCRNNWHSHRGGQLLLVTAGRGFYQEQGQPARALRPGETATVFIGPEGDFSPGEIAFALANGFEEITLGRQRLRTETAALAAVVMASVVNG